MSVHDFTSGTPGIAGSVNDNFSTILRMSAIAALNGARASAQTGHTYYTDPFSKIVTCGSKNNFYYDGTSAGTSSGTSMLFGPLTSDYYRAYGIAAYDLCNNSSVDGTLWTQVEISGAGVNTLSENSIRLYLATSNSVGANTGKQTLTSNNLGGDLSANFRIAWIAENTIVRNGDSPTLTESSWRFVSGTNAIVIGSVAGTATFSATSEYHFYEAVYDASTQYVNFLRDGTSTGSSSLAGWSGAYIQFQTLSIGGGGADSGEAQLHLHGLGVSTATTIPRLVIQNDLTSNISSVALFADATINLGSIWAGASANSGTNVTNLSIPNYFDTSEIAVAGSFGRAYILTGSPTNIGSSLTTIQGAYVGFYPGDI